MKRIVSIQDISCIGKCSETVALPIISSMGVETAILPTAILSTHTAFKNFTFKNLADECRKIMKHWKEENFEFDLIYIGYTGTEEILDLVLDFIDEFKTDKNIVVFDPAMADNGKMYAGITKNIIQKMKEVCKKADILRLNLTEGSLLSGEQYKENSNIDENKKTAEKLRTLGPKKVIITGVEKDNKIGDVLLNVENLSGEYTNLNNVSFQARRGEILGVAGLDGSGRTELPEQIFGITTKKSGKITLDGKEVKNRNPHESIKNGFALLTEERRATGIFGILNIRENTTISSLKKYQSGPFLNEKKMKKTTEEYIKSLRVKTPTQETKISSLSGGNQQKVILARWLLTDPTVLLLDEPTRGIDVGAKYEIYQLILDLAKKGKTVIMVSSEMAELLGVCDKILVMSGGRLSGEVDAKTTNQEEIMTLAAKYV